MSDVTHILGRIETGDAGASAELLPLVYDELRRMAAAQLTREAEGHTLQPTALVHEAYLRLVDQDRAGAWNHRGHFFSAAAESMRRILVDHARRKRAEKRGGDLKRSTVDFDQISLPERRKDLLALDAALEKLQGVEPRKAELVKLRYFAGLTMPQAAETLGISLATAERDWVYAKVWLLRKITSEQNPEIA